MSSWVTNFVSEMRTRSPAVVQKWVDSLPNESEIELLDDTIIKGVERLPESASNLNEPEIFCDANCEGTTIRKVVVDITEQGDDNILTDTHSEVGENETESSHPHRRHSTNESGAESTCHDHRRFWQKRTSILTALRIRAHTDSNQSTETEDLNASHQLPHSNEPDESAAPNPLLSKSKLNELYYKLSINKKRYNFIRERKMEAKKIINNAKSRFLAAAHWDETNAATVKPATTDTTDTTDDDDQCEGHLTALIRDPASAGVGEPEASGSASIVCDTIDMDLSADEFSRLSQSNDMLSATDEDSFNVSMPSINDAHASHLNVSRKLAMVDIGRSTSDNPRLRNKFYLADIGRSFSEHQDDEAIIIGQNISAPSSSIAIQNNNRSNGNFYERRAYSVSPTQRGLRRGVLSCEHSLSDSSRHRNQLSKGSSFQSDSSHCSSVESLLDARKPDSEAILRQLGFGPAHQEDILSRIPKRFLPCFVLFLVSSRCKSNLRFVFFFCVDGLLEFSSLFST